MTKNELLTEYEKLKDRADMITLSIIIVKKFTYKMYISLLWMIPWIWELLL